MPETLPPVPDDSVVEVDLRHVVLSILALSGTALVVGTTLILTRDYVKYLRQKAVVDMAAELIQIITKEIQWSDAKTDASSQVKSLNKGPKS